MVFWILNGLIYVVLLFTTGEWPRLIPTSWDIVPRAFNDLQTYLSFHEPPANEFHPYDPLQQLTYAAVVFLLGPMAIVTGSLQAAGLQARFPRLVNTFGGRQVLRSAHFLTLCAYVIFMVIHVTMVIATDFAGHMNHIMFGTESQMMNGIWWGSLAVLLIIAIHIAVTAWTQHYPRAVQHSIGRFAQAGFLLMLRYVRSHQHYCQDELSPYVRVNGRPPVSEEWLSLKSQAFRDYRLAVSGLVEQPITFSLEQLRALPRATQITKHQCVQGWTAIAEWSGVRLSDVLKLVQPLPNAKFRLLRAYQNGPDGNEFYGTIPIDDAADQQTILAFDMNGKPLPDQYGAPLRLRVETYVGYKMTKWIKSIEFIESYASIFGGQGGYREDIEYQFNLPRA